MRGDLWARCWRIFLRGCARQTYMSTPSTEYWLSHAMTDWIKVARVAAVAAIADQYAEGKFQPPIER